MKTIYTRNEAADIVEMFEDVLSEHDIEVPSDEDDERDEDDMVGLYGSTYYDLLDEVESTIASVFLNGEYATADAFKIATVIVGMFKDVLDSYQLSVPEVSAKGDAAVYFLTDVTNAVSSLLRRGKGAEIVMDEFADELEYEAEKAREEKVGA